MVERGVWDLWKDVFIDRNVLLSLLELLIIFFVWNLLSRFRRDGVYKVLIEDCVGILIGFFLGVEYVGCFFCIIESFIY